MRHTVSCTIPVLRTRASEVGNTVCCAIPAVRTGASVVNKNTVCRAVTAGTLDSLRMTSRCGDNDISNLDLRSGIDARRRNSRGKAVRKECELSDGAGPRRQRHTIAGQEGGKEIMSDKSGVEPK